jgi:uracil-DNA glycosylase family 4
MTDVKDIESEVVRCRRCPRLVEWREGVAVDPPARYRGQTYWARPVPGFGDADARLVVVGLAPAAHGGNRTGRVFTGDRSADWLYRALHRAGYANQAESVSRDDGLTLRGCYVTAVVKCAPPDNKPLPAERDNCIGYLVRELRALTHARTVLALGSFAWDNALRALAEHGAHAKPKPKFGHGAVARAGEYALVGSYHPSQQNTFTGKLTEKMLDDAVSVAKRMSDDGEAVFSKRERRERQQHEDENRNARSRGGARSGSGARERTERID